MTSTSQKGSVHVVIIIILVVALIGSLGWIFWQNFNHSNTDASKAHSNAKSNEGTSKPKQATNDTTLDSEGLHLTIPVSWQSDVNTVAETEFTPKRDSGVIKNRDGSPILFVESGISGLGGTCDPDMQNALTIVNVVKTQAQATPTEGYGGAAVYAVKSYYYDPEQGYAPFVFLSNNRDIESKTTYKTCLPSLIALVNGGKVEGALSIATAGGITSTGGQEFPFVTTKNEALGKLNSDDINEAFIILQTANY